MRYAGNLWVLMAAIALTAPLIYRDGQGGAVRREDMVFADFEGETYAPWTTTGTAFGTSPASGALPQQMAVTGFAGKRLVNSFHGGDSATGRLISPAFPVRHRYVTFLIGGGGFSGRTCINLVVKGKVVRTATGPNLSPGGSELLSPGGWDVQDLKGQTAHLEIVDAATGGWGHINVDQITFTDNKPAISETTRTITAEKRYLNFHIKNGGPKRMVTIASGDTVIEQFEASLADDAPDWWAFVDVKARKGKALTITVNALPEKSSALSSITNTDRIVDEETLYREPLRPQFHFSAKRGWLNDPNGLVYYNGEYLLFFQHCPFYWSGDGPKYWGLAVSKDLVHWTEVEEALAPDKFGAIWSGSAAVDWKNTSGFGKDGKPPVVLMYTAAGDPFTQCLAYTIDGRTVTKFAGNPVLGNITPGNRDPRIFWHEPTQRWVQALWVEDDRKNTVHILTSPDLQQWTRASIVPGQPGSNYLYECPDLFPLPLDGDVNKTKWIITGADSQYTVGSFDGKIFTPETPVLPGHRGKGFYAAQTFNDEPKGRRIQIGWWWTETRGMPFNQSMSLPLELKLVSTPDGPRVTWTPIQDLESLRAKSHTLGKVTVGGENASNPLAAIRNELVEIRATFTPGKADTVTFNVRGIPVVYDAKKQELIVNGHYVPAPLTGGKQSLKIYADRVGLEVFASEGHAFVPMPVNLKPEDTGLSVTASGGSVAFDQLDVHELRSAWR